MAFLKKNTADAGKPADAAAATVPAPEKKKAPRRPAAPGEKMTFGDIAVCGEQKQGRRCKSLGHICFFWGEDTEAMAFISFPPRPQVFWMKNTLIPLDLVFLDLEGRVIAIRQMAVEPQRRADESMEEYEERLPRYAIEMPVYCSLEIRHGLAQEIGLKPGDLIPMLSFNALQKAGVRNWE